MTTVGPPTVLPAIRLPGRLAVSGTSVRQAWTVMTMATTTTITEHTKEAITQETSLEGATKSATLLAKGVVTGAQKGVETAAKGAKGAVEELATEVVTGGVSTYDHFARAWKQPEESKKWSKERYSQEEE